MALLQSIQRQWTVCAADQADLQLWLKIVSHAVDADVGILPDDEAGFLVRSARRSLHPCPWYVKLSYSHTHGALCSLSFAGEAPVGPDHAAVPGRVLDLPSRALVGRDRRGRGGGRAAEGET